MRQLMVMVLSLLALILVSQGPNSEPARPIPQDTALKSTEPTEPPQNIDNKIANKLSQDPSGTRMPSSLQSN